MINGKNNKLVKSSGLILLLVVALTFQGCTSLSQNKSPSDSKVISLKNFYDNLLESKLTTFNQVESIVGKLSINVEELSYSSYSGSNVALQDEYTVHASDVRVHSNNINDIKKVIIDIDSVECLEITSVAKDYGSAVMLVKGASDHAMLTPSNVAYYSTIENDWGYVNFGFDSHTCLKTMAFFKGKSN